MPSTPLFLNPPNEDQIRREIETFTLQVGAGSLIGYRYKEQPPSSFQLDSEDEEDDYRIFSPGGQGSPARRMIRNRLYRARLLEEAEEHLLCLSEEVGARQIA